MKKFLPLGCRVFIKCLPPRWLLGYRGIIFSCFFFSISDFLNAQTVNLIPNPSFETYTTCPTNQIGPYFVKYWKSLDSVNQTNCHFEYYHSCAGVIPYMPGRYYQYPRTGGGMVLLQMYCTAVSCAWSHSHMRVKLKSSLIAGTTYCAKMYVNLADQCKYALDRFGMYFDNGILDTVQPCGKIINFITPQVDNPSGNIINDTVNWIAITGTFSASGNESYLTIGNFHNNAQTNLFAFNPTFPADGSIYLFDDVSVIDFNLSAYAGPDKNIILGDSAFIGRPPEIGLECTWSSGTVTVGNGGGIWVKPPTAGTFSYIVTQNICGNIKKDTVNVNVSPGTISEAELFSKNISFYPQPAKDILNISLQYLPAVAQGQALWQAGFYEKSIEIKIIDLNGRLVRGLELGVRSGVAQLETSEFSNGIYIVQIKNLKEQIAIKRLVIAK